MARISVVGDVMLDVLIEGPATRMSPAAPWAPVILADGAQLRLGGAGFVARVLRGLGHSVQLVCALGQDWPGLLVRDIADSLGLDLGVGISDRTTMKVSVTAVDAGRFHQISRGDVDATDAVFDGGLWIRVDKAADALVCVDYDKGVFRSCDLASPATDWCTLRVADPKPANAVKFRGFDVLAPNHAEAQAILGVSHMDPLRASLYLSRLLHCPNVIVTCGGYGAAGVGRQCSSEADWGGRVAQSTSGAGDVFTGVLVSSLLSGRVAADALDDAERAARRYVCVGELPQQPKPEAL